MDREAGRDDRGRRAASRCGRLGDGAGAGDEGRGRRATGADLASVADDFGKLTEVFEAGGPDARDAETILLGTLVAVDLADSLRDRWNKAVRPLLFDTLVRDACAEGSYAVPTLWWDEGGRIVSTGLMTWAMEAYYKHPYALVFEERR